MGRHKYSALDVLEEYVVDESAVTITELCRSKWIDRNMAYFIRNDMIERGLWEKVKKHGGGGKLADAYRLTRKGRALAAQKAKETENE